MGAATFLSKSPPSDPAGDNLGTRGVPGGAAPGGGSPAGLAPGAGAVYQGSPLPSPQECARRGADTAACEMLRVKQRRAHRGLAGMLPLPMVLVAGALGGGYAVSALTNHACT